MAQILRASDIWSILSWSMTKALRWLRCRCQGLCVCVRVCALSCFLSRLTLWHPVFSAQMAGLLCEEEGPEADNVKYCGYCKHHYNKMVRWATDWRLQTNILAQTVANMRKWKSCKRLKHHVMRMEVATNIRDKCPYPKSSLKCTVKCLLCLLTVNITAKLNYKLSCCSVLFSSTSSNIVEFICAF